jgi:rubrerythrin
MKQDRVFGEPVLDMPESSRRSFLKVAGLVGVGTGLVVGGFGSSIASAATSGGVSDEDILQYALALEYLESTFYDIGDKHVNFNDDRTHQIVGAVRDHEDKHVQLIQGAIKKLGGTPKPKSDYDIKISKPSNKVYGDPKTFLSTAATFEEVGVTAYLGQITHIKNGDILAAAASIEGVEARHSAIFYTLTGQKPFQNGPIDMGASMDKVLGEVKPYITPKNS